MVETPDGAPSTVEALTIMAEAYRRLGIDDMATTIDGIAARNTSPDEMNGKKEGKHRWRSASQPAPPISCPDAKLLDLRLI